MTEAEALLRLALAAGAGALLGLEREERDKPAGVRTFSIVALGSALFTLISIMAFGEDDAGARIPAQIVTGIGFLGAGTIIVHRGNVFGLTTAAGIWAAAAVGMGFGLGLYLLSAGGIVILLVVLRLVGRFMVEVSPATGGPLDQAGADDGNEDEHGTPDKDSARDEDAGPGLR
jgi:putative Mg2+ transporter-C (MgtC) family protein